MHKLCEYLTDEMHELEDKVANGHKLSSSELQYLDTLAHSRKNILKGDEMEEESYSGNYGRRPMYEYPDDTSYGRSYARRRDSMGRYSRRYSGDEAMLDSLRDMMESAPDERTKAEYRKFIAKMESM